MSTGGGSNIHTEEERLAGLRIQQSAYGLPIPLAYGTNRQSGNLIWYGNFRSIAHTTTQDSGGKGGGGGGSVSHTSYTYTASFIVGLCEGEISGVLRSWNSKEAFSGPQTVKNGAEDQAPWDWIMAPHPVPSAPAYLGAGLVVFNGGSGQLVADFSEAGLAYRGTAYVARSDADLGSSGSLPMMSFEVAGRLVDQHGDARPHLIITDLLTHHRSGAGFPGARIGDLSDYAQYTLAADLLISPVFSEQRPTAEILAEISDITNSALVWSEGMLKVVPYADEPVHGNGASFLPNTAPLYDLTDDDFIAVNDPPVRVERKRSADAYNEMAVEFEDRAADYSAGLVQVQDLANIELYGLRPAARLSAKGITRTAVARTVVQTRLQRALYVCNEYVFRLPWRYCLLEPMDRVTLTDMMLGLDRVPVRIVEIEEEADGELIVRAEDAPVGIATPALFSAATGSSGNLALNVDPGDVATPVVFEAPGRFVTTGLAVWVAVTGIDTNWGGANVYASVDGTGYQLIGTTDGGARYGQLMEDINTASGGSADVQLTGMGGQLLSGSSADAEAMSTLILIGDEFCSYTTSTLAAANRYTLTGLVRGQAGSTATLHLAGDRFVRVDERIVKSQALDKSMIGKTIRLKFCSFNRYGRALQSLADVAEYSYTIGGNQIEVTSQPTVRTPTPLSPLSGGATAAGSVQLVAGAYASRPTGIDYHYASQWQIGADAAFGSVLWDSGQTSADLASVVPAYSLAQGQVYWWRVRYRGEVLDWSPWSLPQSFTRSASLAGLYTQIAVGGGPNIRYYSKAAVLDGKLWIHAGYGSGALSDLWVFDPGANNWTQKAAGGAGNDTSGFVVQGGMLFSVASAGSGTITTTLYRYNPNSNTWATLANQTFFVGSWNFVAALNDKLYVLNGARLAAYDVTGNTWTRLADMPSVSGGRGLAVCNGKLYTMEYSSSSFRPWEFDPATGMWIQLAAGPAFCSGYGWVELSGVIYLVAGNYGSQLWQFEPVANVWTQLTSGPYTGRSASAVAAGSGHLWLFGGQITSGSGAKVNDLWKVQ